MGSTVEDMSNAYQFTVDKPVYDPGDQLQITVNGSASFNGFLLYTAGSTDETRRVGKYEIPADMQNNAQVCTNSEFPESSITHTADKTFPGFMNIKYQAPTTSVGDLIFNAIIVQKLENGYNWGVYPRALVLKQCQGNASNAQPELTPTPTETPIKQDHCSCPTVTVTATPTPMKIKCKKKVRNKYDPYSKTSKTGKDNHYKYKANVKVISSFTPIMEPNEKGMEHPFHHPGDGGMVFDKEYPTEGLLEPLPTATVVSGMNNETVVSGMNDTMEDGMNNTVKHYNKTKIKNEIMHWGQKDIKTKKQIKEKEK